MAAHRKLGVYVTWLWLRACCVFTPRRIWTMLLGLLFYPDCFMAPWKKGSFQRLAELLRTVLRGTFKDSDMKATIDSWWKQPFVSKVLPFRPEDAGHHVGLLEQPAGNVEEPTSNSIRPSNSAVTVHVCSTLSLQKSIIDVWEKVTSQDFTSSERWNCLHGSTIELDNKTGTLR